MDVVKLYIPSSVVVKILLRYILYKKPKHRVRMLNRVNVNNALIIFLMVFLLWNLLIIINY